MKLGVAFTRREIRTVCIVDHANAVKKDRGFRAIDVVALADLLSSKGSSLLALQTAFRDFFEVRLGELQQALLYIGRGTVTMGTGERADKYKTPELRLAAVIAKVDAADAARGLPPLANLHTVAVPAVVVAPLPAAAQAPAPHAEEQQTADSDTDSEYEGADDEQAAPLAALEPALQHTASATEALRAQVAALEAAPPALEDALRTEQAAFAGTLRAIAEEQASNLGSGVHETLRAAFALVSLAPEPARGYTEELQLEPLPEQQTARTFPAQQCCPPPQLLWDVTAAAQPLDEETAANLHSYSTDGKPRAGVAAFATALAEACKSPTRLLGYVLRLGGEVLLACSAEVRASDGVASLCYVDGCNDGLAYSDPALKHAASVLKRAALLALLSRCRAAGARRVLWVSCAPLWTYDEEAQTLTSSAYLKPPTVIPTKGMSHRQAQEKGAQMEADANEKLRETTYKQLVLDGMTLGLLGRGAGPLQVSKADTAPLFRTCLLTQEALRLAHYRAPTTPLMVRALAQLRQRGCEVYLCDLLPLREPMAARAEKLSVAYKPVGDVGGAVVAARLAADAERAASDGTSDSPDVHQALRNSITGVDA